MDNLTAETFRTIIVLLGQQADDDIAWSEGIQPPENAEDFAMEAIFVICNSGMKNTIARKIFNKIVIAIGEGQSASTVFGHAGKAAAIDDIWRRREELLHAYFNAADKVEFCATLPWIGPITKFHLAKNFGADVAKPDVHLQRLADREDCSVPALCARLALATGYRVATIDVVLWRACANGIVNSKTGRINALTEAGRAALDKERET